ncbi:MAG: ATP-binding protein [Candidatus Polarisedimenticolia bacterium]
MPPISPLSLRTALRTAVVSVVALSMVMAVLLSVMTTVLHRSMLEVSRALEGARIAGEVQSELLNQVRLAAVARVFDRGQYDTLRAESRARVENLLTAAGLHVGNPAEQHLLDRTRQELTSYFAERDRLEARGTSLVEILQWSTPRLEAILGGAQQLQALNEEQATTALEHSNKLNERADVLGALVFTMITVATVLLLIAGNRHIYQPLKRLAETINRFSQGDRRVRSEELGPQEVRDVARAFNEMSDALSRRRQAEMESLAGVVHDLKNPLAGSKMLLPVLSRAFEAGDVPSARRISQLLDRQLADLSIMTADLLDAARVESGHLALHVEPVDLETIVREAAEVVGHTSAAHRIEVVSPGHGVPLQADPARLSQVFRNLLDNAIKYSPSGGRVGVRIEALGSGVRVTVSDQGMGIRPEDIPSLFHPFWRSEQARRSAPGTGLGLSVVERIVRAHGGSVAVQSRPGEGTEFSVTLPRLEQTAAGETVVLH